MSTSLKPGSSDEGDIDAALLSLDNHVKTLESSALHLEVYLEARKRASELLKSQHTPLEEYAADVDDFVQDAHMQQALQLADEHNRLLLPEDKELKFLCAENSQICNKVMEKQKAELSYSHLQKLGLPQIVQEPDNREAELKLEESRETIWRLKKAYYSLIAEKTLLEESPDQGSKLSPEEKKNLETEQHRLKVLNNVLLQLITSSRVNWCQDSRLSALVKEASDFI